ncbi:hypothetical protein GCM10010528_18330 [Gordonia defluvii]|uniref:FHA domain-containing protein n=1 Tax=Gordonia defluvii TaxID=283718 RepID=A0ABP6LD13_9ACTN|nr:hypothetical protein [Gordonia sp. UBA5067]
MMRISGESAAVPTGELSVIDAPRQRRAGAGAVHRASRSRAAQRAVDRRAARLAREARKPEQPGKRGRIRPQVQRPGLIAQIRSMPFAVPVIGLVAAGLIATLWLSTRAAQDSYELTVAKVAHQSLVDKRDALKRTYESADSAPELSDKAARLGLVPARNSARLVVGDNGRVNVRGTPAPAAGRAPRSINPKPIDEALRHIDANKVEDSTGLPGADPASQPDPGPPVGAPPPSNPSRPDDQGQAQAPGQIQTPGQQANTPAPTEATPNVLPQSDAATRGAPRTNPRRNS